MESRVNDSVNYYGVTNLEKLLAEVFYRREINSHYCKDISELCSNALRILALAMLSVGALVHHRQLGFDSKLASTLQEIPHNVVLAMIIVALGLLAILFTPILPLLAAGAVAFFISCDRRAVTKFAITGGLTAALGALTIVALPRSPTTHIRLEGSPFTRPFCRRLART